jgi:hypothetical protein
MKATTATRDRRVTEIIDLLMTEAWTPLTPKVLGAKWKLPKQTVYQMRGEALRLIRLGLGTADKDGMRDQLMLRLNNLYQMAHAAGDTKGAVAALKLAAQLTGVLVHRHELTGLEKIRDELVGKTDAELQSELKVLEIKAVAS